MDRKRTTKLTATVLAFLLMAGSLWLFYDSASGLVIQQRHLSLARSHLPAVTNALAGHPEFRQLGIGAGTMARGCVLIVGPVENESQIQTLKDLVEATRPPVVVLYNVYVPSQANRIRK